MKKLLSCFLFALMLAGCRNASGPVKPEDMNPGFVHFAASLILEDIIRKGDSSIYAQLAPGHVLSPDRVLHADEIIDNFRHDYAAAEDRYARLRGTGTAISTTVTRVDREAREIVFVKEDPQSRPPFTGTLRISLDREFYDDANMPDYGAGADVTFMCAEYRPVHDFRNEKVHRIEVRMIQCQTAGDYYARLQERIKERLTGIFHGRESVNPELAKGLATLYLAGQSLPDDSVCLDGSFLACRTKLDHDLTRERNDVRPENIGAMQIDPEKVTARRLDRVSSGPAERPGNANRSPSGNRIHEQPEQVREQKEVISRVRAARAR